MSFKKVFLDAVINLFICVYIYFENLQGMGKRKNLRINLKFNNYTNSRTTSKAESPFLSDFLIILV